YSVKRSPHLASRNHCVVAKIGGLHSETISNKVPLNKRSDHLKSAFEELSTPYVSGSQTARVQTERWVSDHMYCINCGSPRLNQFPNNSPLADFFVRNAKISTKLNLQKTSLVPE